MQLLHYVSHTLVVKQDRAAMYHLTPVWAPVEPPAKRAKTAEVRLSSTGDVSMTLKKEENEQGSSDEEDSDSSGSNSDVSSEDDTSDVSDLDKFFFFLHCRAHHYSSDGHEVGKKTTTSRHRGEPPKTKQTQKHKPKTNKNQTTPTKRLPKKARTGVKRCETCDNATLKLSNVLLQEVVPNKVRRSVQRCSVSNYLLCIYHTSRSISEKVASSRSGLLSSI